MYNQGTGRKLCRYYQQGQCRFGDSCRFSHDEGEDDYSTSYQPPNNFLPKKRYNNHNQYKQSAASAGTPRKQFSLDFEHMSAHEFMDRMSDDIYEHIFQGSMYPFTSYGYQSFLMPGLEDKSMEEARFEYRTAESSNNLMQHMQQVERYTKERVQLLIDLKEKPQSRPFFENLQAELRKCQDEYHRVKTRANLYSQQEVSGSMLKPSVFGKGDGISSSGNVFGGATSGATDKAASLFAAAKAEQNKSTSASNLFNNTKSNESSSTAAGIFASAKKEETGSTSDFFLKIKAFQGCVDGANGLVSLPQSTELSSTKMLFGKPVGSNAHKPREDAAKNFFVNVAKSVENKPQTLFGKSVGQTGGTAFGGTTIQSDSKPSLFSKSAAREDNSSSQITLFGTKAADDTKTSKPRMLFGKVVGTSPHADDEMDKFYYSNKEELSKADLDAFTAETFTLGKIPYILPPKELCV